MLYFWNDKLTVVRIDEFKLHLMAQQEYAFTKNGYHGGFGGDMSPAMASFMVNLYTDPQEDDHIGIRHIPIGVPLNAEFARYMNVLKKYPGRVQVALGQ